MLEGQPLLLIPQEVLIRLFVKLLVVGVVDVQRVLVVLKVVVAVEQRKLVLQVVKGLTPQKEEIPP